MNISDTAVQKIEGNNRTIGRLMIAFDRGQKSIENWLRSRDVRLTTPTAIAIIKEETGLAESEILESEELAKVC